VDYEMADGRRRLRDHSIKLYSLTDFTSLTTAAFQLNLIDSEELKLLKDWHSDPKKWSEQFRSFGN
jgi:orotate phosphoribosyltransferase